MDRTYFFFSSDHGFQLGQFNIPMDKRHVYEWDTKNLRCTQVRIWKAMCSFESSGLNLNLYRFIFALCLFEEVRVRMTYSPVPPGDCSIQEPLAEQEGFLCLGLVIKKEGPRKWKLPYCFGNPGVRLGVVCRMWGNMGVWL